MGGGFEVYSDGVCIGFVELFYVFFWFYDYEVDVEGFGVELFCCVNEQYFESNIGYKVAVYYIEVELVCLVIIDYLNFISQVGKIGC